MDKITLTPVLAGHDRNPDHVQPPLFRKVDGVAPPLKTPKKKSIEQLLELVSQFSAEEIWELIRGLRSLVKSQVLEELQLPDPLPTDSKLRTCGRLFPKKAISKDKRDRIEWWFQYEEGGDRHSIYLVGWYADKEPGLTASERLILVRSQISSGRPWQETLTLIKPGVLALNASTSSKKGVRS